MALHIRGNPGTMGPTITMKVYMRYIMLGCLLLAGSRFCFASHAHGGSIEYAWVNSCTVRVATQFYYDCSQTQSLPYTGPANFTWDGGPGCSTPLAIGPWVVDSVEVSPICPSAVTRCSNPNASINGHWNFFCYRDYDVCSVNPCLYNLSFGECCRAPGNSSIDNPQMRGLWITNTSINTASFPRNNSPRFLGPPVLYINLGQTCDLSYGAYDPDGDSLVFELGDCWHSATVPVTYNSTYSYTQPFGQSWNITINPTTGLIHFEQVPGSSWQGLIVGTICVYVTEYRNGIEVGRVMRDVEITVVTNPQGNDVPLVGGVTNLSPGATVVGDEVFVCQPGPVSFDITGTDSTVNQGLLLGWSHNYPTATFTQVGNPTVQDTIPGTSANPPAGHFSFTPPGYGHYYVRFILTDGQCPLLGLSERVIAIHVGNGPPAVSVNVGTCPDVSFSASGCGMGPISYSWTGAGGLNGSTSAISHTYPGPGSYPWELVVQSAYHTDTVRDTVVVPGTSYQGVLSGAGVHYVAPCSGNTHDTIDAGSGWQSYLWSTGDTTQAIDVFLGGYYGLTVTDVNGCAYYDSIQLWWASPEIYGVVRTSYGDPLQNQKIMLVEHDTLLQALWGVDSTWTDSSGYYFFCNVMDSLVFLKALPLLADYPTQMPTYADTTLFWNGALAFQPLGMMPFQHDFSSLYGVNPGGPGFIGGFITQGANKVSAVGDPVPGVRIFLRNRVTGAVLGYRDSNPVGYFSFAGIPLGDYELVPDRVNVSTSNVPLLSLSAQTPVMDSLDLRLHRYWLELVPGGSGTGISGVVPEVGVSVFPNPFGDVARVEVELPEEVWVEVDVMDILGRKVERVFAGVLREGRHAFAVGESLAAGSYYLRVRVGDRVMAKRLVRAVE
jgi:hypothetical protein